MASYVLFFRESIRKFATLLCVYVDTSIIVTRYRFEGQVIHHHLARRVKAPDRFRLDELEEVRFCRILRIREPHQHAFALMLTSNNARTAPPSIPSALGTAGIEWSAIAFGSLIFLIPVVIVTFALRNYLLRGITFGAIRQ